MTTALSKNGITTEFKTKGATAQIEEVRFTKGGYHFNGSQVDRQFSYSKINATLGRNEARRQYKLTETRTAQQQPQNDYKPVEDVAQTVENLFFGMMTPSYQDMNDEEQRLMKRKKKKGIRF